MRGEGHFRELGVKLNDKELGLRKTFQRGEGWAKLERCEGGGEGCGVAVRGERGERRKKRSIRINKMGEWRVIKS